MAKKFQRQWVKCRSLSQAKGYRLIAMRKKTHKRVIPTLRFTLEVKKMPRRKKSILS